MKTIASVFLVLALAFAVVLGGQTEAWSWGPALVALAVSALIAAISGVERPVARILAGLLALNVSWLLWRAWISPVVEFARADAMLILAVLAVAVVVAAIRSEGGRPMRVLWAGLALVLIGNGTMALIQVFQPEILWPYSRKPTTQPTGFFGHYNYFSNFMIGGGLLLASRVLARGESIWLKVLAAAALLVTLVSVPMTGSRGGTLALACGTTVLIIAWISILLRRKKKVPTMLLIGLPLLLVAALIGGGGVLQKIQSKRATGGDVLMADNTSRLEWMELSLETIALHPWLGGGSRSYSWERNSLWDVDNFGYGTENERFVHNELLQLTTDYGAIGLILMLALLGTLLWTALLPVLQEDREGPDDRQAMGAGILGGGVAMLIQANFSFVFHMLPSVLMLGVMLGLALTLGGGTAGIRRWPAVCARFATALVALTLCLLGWQASSALRSLWPVLYASGRGDDPSWIDQRFEKAARHWPGFRIMELRAHFALERGREYRIGDFADPAESRRWLEQADELYAAAAGKHPFHPGLRLNRANALSELGRAEEAEREFLSAIELQGGLETAFRARYFFARHLYFTWYGRWTRERRAEEALREFQRGVNLLDEAAEVTPKWVFSSDGTPLRAQLVEAIGFLESAGVRPAP